MILLNSLIVMTRYSGRKIEQLYGVHQKRITLNKSPTGIVVLLVGISFRWPMTDARRPKGNFEFEINTTDQIECEK